MGSFSNDTENDVLDLLFGGTSLTPATTYYLALYTTAPTDAGGGTECSGGAYERLAVTNNSTNFPAASNGAKSNGADLEWDEQTTDLGTIVAVGFHTHATNDTLVAYADGFSKEIKTGDVPFFAEGDLDITLT